MSGPSWKRLYAVTLMALVPLVLACEAGEQGGQPGMEEQPGQQPGQQQEPMGGEETSESSSFEAIGEADVSGDAEFTRTGGSITVAVQMDNLPGGAGDYASHIHDGTCDDYGGVVTPLNDVSGTEAGSGQATTEVDAAQFTPGSPYVAMVHSQEGPPIACAEVPDGVLGG